MSNIEIFHPKDSKFSITDIAHFVEKNRRKLYDLPTSVILDMLSELSKKIILSDLINEIEGIAFFAKWLRRENLLKMYRRDLLDEKVLDQFVFREGKKILAQPRGIVCHWVASNVDTLALFSLFQMILCKNANLIKIPIDSEEIVSTVLKMLEEIEVVFEGKSHNGKIITDTIGVFSFPSSEKSLSEELSLCADLRVVWGSRIAAQEIENLAIKEHGETLVFGPKYSLGIFDSNSIESKDFTSVLGDAVIDIITFDQMACSSPHIYFFEKKSSKSNRSWIMEKLKLVFDNIESKKIFRQHQHGICTQVINARAKHFLEQGSDVIASKDLGWTLLANDLISLEDPVYGRTIFIKEIVKLEEILPLINRNIQCVSLAMKDEKRREFFTKELSYRGVDRCVSPGDMHHFDFPWDGIFPLGRAVRWVSLK